jgi:hypothetical protein
MTITVDYQKRKNTNLFIKFQTNNSTNLTNIQNYMPIYERFFSLNNTNYNSINLNHQLYISDIKDTNVKDICNENILNCKLKHITDNVQTTTKSVFIKMAPLLDPFKYIIGKYPHSDPNLFNLPSFDKTINVHPKIMEQNNSAYIDGFFSFLTSKILHEHNFIHGVDYYGSFLAIKNNYKLNIIDDLDYLVQSDFFNKQKNVLFNVEDFSHLMSNHDDKKPLKPLKISASLKSNVSIKSIDDSMFENIFENDTEHVSLTDIKNMGLDIVDITNSYEVDTDTNNQKKTESLRSGSTCSSRTSHTNDNDENDFMNNKMNFEDEDEDEVEDDLDELEDNDNEKMEEKMDVEEIPMDIKEMDITEMDIEDEYEDVDSDDEEDEKLILTFDKFPVQVICMEQCEDTFDNLIINGTLTNDEWFSALMQIIMILITYQKMFSFTHNDLHTNNIMYIPTNKKFVYYIYKKKTYKVPTFGKLYKIIDFGRAIYKFNGNIFCSDSFQIGGDAATQYNTEPYFNDKKPRLEPNFSFDLCRLACSIFDYVVDDLELIKNLDTCSPIIKLIVEWCMDDNSINVLYKNNGAERYPDFKLYKMIARHVHRHTPNAQLDRPEFSNFIVSNKTVSKIEQIINIDDLPCYC